MKWYYIALIVYLGIGFLIDLWIFASSLKEKGKYKYTLLQNIYYSIVLMVFWPYIYWVDIRHYLSRKRRIKKEVKK